MKLILENWRKYIAEDVDLGKFVWPSAIAGHPSSEIDTDIEEELYKQLHNHFGAIAPLSDEAVAAMKSILDSDKYSDVFRRCNEGKVYRGLRLPLSWLEQNAPQTLENLPDERSLDFNAPVEIEPMTYKPEGKYGNVSSWTGTWKEARNFTTRAVSGTLPVILYSNCATGYFMGTTALAKYKGGRYKDEFGINKLNPNAHEKEILLFGECLVMSVQIRAAKKDIDKLR